jgi:cytoskeletal protein RodZ
MSDLLKTKYQQKEVKNMTTIVNNPTPSSETGGSNSFGFLLGMIVLVGSVALLLYFGIPALQRMGPAQINVPAAKIVMPDKVDVNVQQTK